MKKPSDRNDNDSRIASALRFMLTSWREESPRSVAFAALRIPVLILLPLLMSLIPKLILDCMALGTDYLTFAIYVITASLLIVALRWLEPYLSEKLNLAAQAFRLDCTMRMLRKLMRADYAALEHPDTKQKLDAARQFAFEGRFSESQRFYEILTLFVANLLGATAYCVLLFRVHPLVLTAFALSAAGEFFLLQKRNRQKSKYKDIMLSAFAKADALHSAAADTTAGKDIRVYQINRWFKKVFADLLKKLLNANGLFIKQNLTISAARTILLLIRELAGFITLFWFAWESRLSIPDFVFYCGVITGFSAWLTGISQQREALHSVCDSCARYREFLEVEDAPGRPALQASTQNPAEIELRGVFFTYSGSDDAVLQDISLTIRPGERIALVGENGAGKTTLVNLLCGFYRPDLGEVLIDGAPADARQIPLTALFQNSVVLPMSIKANIALCKDEDIDEERLKRVLRDADLHDKISAWPEGWDSQLVAEVYDDAVGLSGGERQRLLLARALYHDAGLLVLDEPTAALDPLAEERIYQAYDSFSKGRTVIFVSHRLASTRFCDRIVLLQNGKIAEQGTHGELLEKRGLYFSMFTAQSEAYHGKAVTYE